MEKRIKNVKANRDLVPRSVPQQLFLTAHDHIKNQQMIKNELYTCIT